MFMNLKKHKTMPLTRLTGTVAVLLCLVGYGRAEETSSIVEALPPVDTLHTVKPALPAVAPRADLLGPVLLKKRTTVLAGSALFFSGCVIQYGLILPKSLTLKPTDLEDQLALLSPSLLATGLRYAGTPMSCMRTSEAVDAFRRYSGPNAPKNRAWTLYYCGWGMTIFSGVFGGARAVVALQERWQKYDRFFAVATQTTAIGADVAWAAANIYSWFFIKKMGAGTTPGQVSVMPAADGRGGMGLSMAVRF
jgi:hypothetical protein